MEQDLISTINDMIQQYGATLWLAFVSLVVTGFALTMIKDFVADVVFYVRARMSDIGFSQRIYYSGEIYLVRSIHFKYIVIYDDKKIIRIPIKNYLSGDIMFPQPRYDDFNEEHYHQKKWDGSVERRGDRGGQQKIPKADGLKVQNKPEAKPDLERLDENKIAHTVTKSLTDCIVWLLLGEDRYSELFGREETNFDEVERADLGRLSEEDFNNINTGLSAFLQKATLDSFNINTKGEKLDPESDT